MSLSPQASYNTHKGVIAISDMDINDFCVDVKFCSFLLTAVDHFLCFSFGGKGVGRKSS